MGKIQFTRIRVALIASAIVFAVSIPPMVWAASSGSFGIVPANPDPEVPLSSSWFLYEVDPGEVIEDAVQISNDRAEAVTFSIEAVDAITLEGGGFGLLDGKAENENLGSWVELEETEITLGPHSKKVINFKVTVPENAEVGDHIGGLVMQAVGGEPDQVLQSGGSSVRILTRVGARMYLTVLGDIVRDFKILSTKFFGRLDKMVFRFHVENLGNLRNELKTDIRIYGIFGLYDKIEDYGIDQIFPKEKVKKEVTWPGKKDRPIFGPFLALITVKDTYEPMTRGDHTTFITPPPKPVHTWAITFFIPYTQTIVVIILLFLTWFIRQFILWRRAVRLARLSVIEYKVKTGDHLMDIAEDYETSWKLLAKLNDIKPPHSLRHITTIYVPDARGTRRDVALPNFFVYLTGPLVKLAGRFKRKVRKLKDNEQTIVIEQGDKIRDVEQFTGMPWEEILAYNRLRSTYRLRAGRELIVPKVKQPPAKKPTTRRRKK